MKTRIHKWGNSLALRIPKAFADDTGIAENSPVELSLAKGKLVVRPLGPKPRTLAELLRSVTAKNLHREVDTGPAVGGEAW